VDATDCRIFEQRKDPGSKWYSHKFNGPGLRYEVCIDVVRQRVVWINGPFNAGEPDISIARKPGGLVDSILQGKKAIADKGYKGEPNKISVPNPHDSEVTKQYKNRARSRHETFFKRIKDFGILQQRFRSKIEKHKIAFEAVCVVVQYDIEDGHPLFAT
jgi:hypothetical protein